MFGQRKNLDFEMFINKMRSTYAFGTLVTGPDHPKMHEMISATDLGVQVTNIKQPIILKKTPVPLCS